MAVNRKPLIALIAAGAFAIAVPLALLLPGRAAKAPEQSRQPVPISAAPAPALAAVYERTMFGTLAPAENETPTDAPSLIGIVGRLGEDAVALVRTAEGTTRSLRIGDSVDGWNLASLAIDAAFFTRGTERARVPLPAG